ncbi:acyl-CoA thioesterase [Thalassospira marina]|uniref:Thioesterase n=1 Tax=Thalassospira marina TaxID=2048283 RepID=A0A2N3KMM1_9PROT|nr:acyl-CoA thioesterase [Thalassospira marina]PKR51808.1 thioesterase [Thalassospira marina]
MKNSKQPAVPLPEKPAFICLHKVGFAHCDPAGIVFYPRYFEMVNATVEEWFEARLGFGFARIHGAMEAAVPTASINVDFMQPSRLGEVLHFHLYVTRLGRSSLDVHIRAGGGDAAADAPLTAATTRFQMNATLVFTKKGVTGSAPWPDDLRAALEREITKQDQHDT